MNKIEPNMYVRTKDGYIAKCIYYDNELENIYGFDSVVRKSFSDTYDFIYCNEEKYITKASHNIIDLIEVGDFVNSNEVIEKDLSFVYTHNRYGNRLLCKDENIKSIVTKEAFQNAEYRVETD